MKELKIKFDFSHGPVWKDVYDVDTGKWSTGIKAIDNDMALEVLNDAAEKEYSSLYSFDNSGRLLFDSTAYEKKKENLLSLVKTIILRINEINCKFCLTGMSVSLQTV